MKMAIASIELLRRLAEADGTATAKLLLVCTLVGCNPSNSEAEIERQQAEDEEIAKFAVSEDARERGRLAVKGAVNFIGSDGKVAEIITSAEWVENGSELSVQFDAVGIGPQDLAAKACQALRKEQAVPRRRLDISLHDAKQPDQVVARIECPHHTLPFDQEPSVPSISIP